MRQFSILLFCLLAATANGASLGFKSGVHSDLCAWGPQYWCSSKVTADRCGKTQHCQEQHWTRDLIRDERCTATQKIIKTARQSLTTPVKQMSDIDIAMTLARTCGYEKEAQLRLLCKDLVTDKDVLPKLLKLALSKLPTMSVAVAVGGCRRQEIEIESCSTECEHVIKNLQLSAGKVLTRDVYMRMFKPLCSKTGAANHVCEAMAHDNYEKFVRGITSAVPSKVCPKDSTCLKKSSVLKRIKTTSTECVMCKDVVGEIRAMARSSEVQGAIRSLIKSVCTHLGEFQELCDTLADEGLTYVAELIVSEMEPDVVCESFNLCKDPERKNLALPVPVGEKSTLKCTLCKLVMNAIDEVIQDDKEEDKVVAVLEQFCFEMPESVKEECKSFVEEYGKTIIDLLAKQLEPGHVCPLLHLCEDEESFVAKPPLPNFDESDDELCQLCEYLVTYLDDLLKKNTTMEEIKALLDKVCKDLPSAFKTECNTLVQKFFPLLEMFLEKGFPPKQACQGVKMCPAAPLTNQPHRPEGDSTECNMCELVVTEFTHILSEKSTKEEIDAALEKACHLLPASDRDSCTSIVDTYAPLILQLLAEELKPAEVCKLLKLCAPSQSSVKTTSSLGVRKENADLCPICEFAIQQLDGILKENSTEQEIEAALEQVCQFLPATLKTECDSLIKTYAPQLIQLLLSYSPSDVCKLLGLCTSSRLVKTTSYLGVRKENADLCPICEFAIQQLDGILKENSTEQEIEAALEQVCQFLPATLKTECDSLIKTYAPQLIQLLLSYSPSDVCKLLGLCTSSRLVKTTSYLGVRKENADLCPICEFAIQQLDGILKENSTEQEIEAALEQVCQLLPATLKTECDSLIKTYAPQLIQLLLSYSPSDVCKLLGLCTSSRLVKTTSYLGVRKENADLCPICEFAIQQLDGILKENSTEQEIEAALEQVCQLLPATLKTECDSLIKTYAPQLIQLLLSYSPSDVCKLLGLCTSSRLVKTTSYLGVRKENADLCPICEFAIQQLDGILKENSTEQEIEAALEQVCQLLPATLKTECDSLIKTYAPQLIQLLLSYSPSDVCKLLGLCTSSRLVKTTSYLGVRKENADLCPICEFAIQQLDGILKENSTEQEIEAALEQVCQFLPATLKTECDSLIKTYAPQLIQLLLSYSPSDVCKLLGLCTSSRLVKTTSYLGVRKENADLCPICEFAIQQLDGILKENSTEQEIEAALEQVCQFLPATLKTECDSLIKTYAPQLIQLLLSYSPSDVCKLLGLCTSSRLVKTTSYLGVRKENADLCPICEFAIQQLDGILKENSTEQEIEAALEQVCQFLPATLKTECDSLIKTYAPQLIQLLLSYSPSDVCKLLGLCTSSRLVKTTSYLGVRKENADLCPICEFAIQQLDGILKENSTEQEIEAALEQVCQFLPATLKTECDSLIKTYAPQLIQLLLSYSPSDVCKLLGLCTSSRLVKTTSYLGVRKENADLCPICEFAIQQLDGILKENSTEQEIEAALEQVCQFLPATLKTECDSLIKTYAPQLIQLLLSYSPSDVCKLLGLCTSSRLVKTTSYLGVRKENADLCPICEFAIQQLDGILKENSTEQEIEAALEQVCQFLPATLKTECDSLIKTYAPQLIQLLLSYSPSDVCKLLGLCTSSRLVKTTSYLGVRKENADLCPICEFAIQQLDGILKENSTEQEIEAALEQVCQFLPATLKTECDSLIKTYAPQLIQLLLSYSPSDVCKLLGLCTSSRLVKTTSYLGVRKENADLCPICEFAIQQLDGILKENSTEQEIEAALEQVCQFLPATLKTECDSLIKTYAPQLIQLLLSYSPSDVCKLLGLCTSSRLVKTTSYLGVRKENADLCPICEFAIQQLDGILKENSTEQEIEAALEQVCQFLPATLKTECDSLIKTYAPQLIQLLLSYSPSDVCKLLGLCTSSRLVKTTSYLGVRKENADLCPICEFAIQQLDGILKENSTEQEIEAALEQVCQFLPATLKTECDSLIKTYAPQLIQLLLSYSPSDVCKLLGLCTSSRLVKTTSYLGVRKENADLCPICEFAIQQLDGILKENSTEQEIEAALEQVCQFLPATLKTECDSLIKTYAPQLIQLLLSYSPSDVCKLLGLCTSSRLLKTTSYLGVRKENADLCPICEFAIQQLDGILKENSTEQEIEAALEQVCQFLPATLKTECDSLIKTYAPQLIQLLLSYSPSDVCKLLGLCTSSRLLKTTSYLGVRKENADLCPICEFAIQQLDGILKENSTEQEIEAALEQVCQFLPATLKTECDSLIKTYAPQLIQLLLSYSPSDVCKLLGLCTSSRLAMRLPVPSTSTEKAGPLCALCEFTMTKLDDILKENSTEQEIEAALDMVCQLLPESIRNECEQLVQKYTPFIVQLLVANLQPKQVCTTLALCPMTAHHIDAVAVARITKQVEAKKGELCPLCKMVFSAVDQMLDSNATKKEAIALLDRVCDELPSSIKSQCEPFVTLYAPYVLDLVVQKFTPSVICQYLTLCSSTANPESGESTALIKKTVGESELCTLCEYVLQYLDNILSENSTEAEIGSALEMVCHIIPASLKDECDALIKLWTPQLIAYVVHEVHPKEICVSIGICNAHVEVPKNELTVSVGADGCEICQTVLSLLDGILKDNATREEIVDALTKVCDIVPGSIKASCNKYIRQYFHEIVDLLLDFPASEICKLINLCPSPKDGLHARADLKCELCELVINNVKSMISSTSTEDEIETALEKVCALLSANMKKSCDNLVETNTPTIIKLLLQQLPARQVCIELGICSNDKTPKTVKSISINRQALKVKDGECELCTTLMTELENMLSDKTTQEQIRNALDFVCTRVLPHALSDECVKLVDTYEPLIIQYLTQSYSPKDICTLLQLCQSSAPKTVKLISINRQALKVKDGECELCTAVMTELENMLSDKTTQEQVRNALDFVCSRVLPHALSDECVKLVDTYEPLLIQYLTQSYSPKDICTLLQLCQSSDKQSKILPRPVTSGPLCPLCQYVAQTLDTMLQDNSTEKEIEQALEKICTNLPPASQHKCISFVDLFAPQILDFLIKEMKPSSICTQLKLCDSEMAQVKASVMKKSSNTLTCDLCEMVISKLKSEISSKSSEAEIEAALKKVCSVLPKSLESECDSLVDAYASEIIHLILQDLTAEEICQKIGLCSSSVKALVMTKSSNTLTCDLCEMVISKLKSEISSKSSEAEIEAALKKVCSVLPKSLESECDSLVDAYASEIIHLILQDLTAEEICQKIGLCSSSVKVSSTTKQEGVQGMTCVLCEIVMNKLKYLISSKTSEAEIESALKKVCYLLPELYQDECNTLVNTYTSAIVHLILSDVSAEQICKELGLCSSSLNIRTDGASVEGCTLCEFVLEEAKGFIEKKSTVMELTEALKYVCHQLPAELTEPCADLAIMFGPNLVNYLSGKIAPKQMCQMVKLCPAPKPSNVKSVKVRQPPKSLFFKSERQEPMPAVLPSIKPDCSACKFALYDVQTALSTSFWQDESPKIINLLCDRIKQWPDVCRFMVVQNLPKLISDAQGFRFPIEFCQELELCEAPKPDTAVVNLAPKESCSLCSRLVDYMDYSNMRRPMDAESVCGFLVPEEQKPHCLSLIKNYGSLLSGLLKKHKDPLLVCQTVNVCPKNSGPEAPAMKFKPAY